MNVPYFNSVQVCFYNFLTNIFIWFFVCMSLMHYYKKVADKRSETAAPLFFGMLVFVVCIVACFNEVLLLAFVHYSFTSVSICQNLLIEFGKLSESEDFLWSKVLHQSKFYRPIYKTLVWTLWNLRRPKLEPFVVLISYDIIISVKIFFDLFTEMKIL